MNLPRGLLGAGLVFWGWQTGNLAVGVGLAVIVEAARWSSVRFELRPVDLARVADLCTVIFLAVGAVVAASSGFRSGILAALTWLPAVLAPIMLAQLVSTAGQVPLSALFQRLRRRRRLDPSLRDPLVDLGGAYLGLCVVAGGCGNLRGPGYYAGMVLLAAWALLAVRPPHARLGAWAGALAIASAAGYAGQAGLAQLQGELENWYTDWNLRGIDADPYRSTTDIGSIGRLKQHDAIVLRVYAEPRVAARMKLLHRASFTTYAGTTWNAPRAPLVSFAPRDDGATWVLGDGRATASASVAMRLERGKALLALPAGTVAIAGLPATEVKRNALGAVQAEVGGDWVRYDAAFGEEILGSAAPRDDDVALPAAERAAFEQLASELGLRGVPAEEAVRRVAAHFAGFSYSTFRDEPVPAGATALGDFLTRTKRGHCEYFAAATTLALRAAGVPARYATGFAMLEYSALERAYLVRARHAHAWTRAWVDGRWIEVDTTPPGWFEEEAHLAPAWQRLADLFRWASYRWSQRGEVAVGGLWYVPIGLLVAVLGWRVLRGRRAAGSRPMAAGGAACPRPGLDSEFYAVERALAERGYARAVDEPLGTWALSVGASLGTKSRAPFERAVRLHLQHRFDPQGLDETERAALHDTVLAVLAALETDARESGGLPARPS